MLRQYFGQKARNANDNAPWGPGDRLRNVIARYAEIINRNNQWSDEPDDFQKVFNRLCAGNIAFMHEPFGKLQKERAGLIPPKTLVVPPRRHDRYARDLR